MRLFLLFVIFTFQYHIAFGQSCEGTIGDQLFLENFGSGPGPGPALPAGTTTYTFGTIGGGNYVVTNNSGLNGGLWHKAPDHTPNDTDGYMLLFDAAGSPGVFFQRVFDDLCGNSRYVFGAFVANIVVPSACSGTFQSSRRQACIAVAILPPATVMRRRVIPLSARLRSRVGRRKPCRYCRDREPLRRSRAKCC